MDGDEVSFTYVLAENNVRHPMKHMGQCQVWSVQY